MNHKLQKIAALLLLSVTLTACGKEDPALTAYKEDMSSFCQNIQEQTDIINAIDATSETASTDLLQSLDALDAEFTSMAALEIPEQFTSIDTLATEAGSYMSEAVTLYHEVFEADSVDTNTLEAANENYERAIKRVQYIGDILMGNLPEGEDVSVSYEDSNPSDTVSAE